MKLIAQLSQANTKEESSENERRAKLLLQKAIIKKNMMSLGLNMLLWHKPVD
jgi:hypothetical protein